MYSKKAVTLALTLLLLSSYAIIDFDQTSTENRDARLSSNNELSKDETYRTRFAGGNGTEDDPYQISNVTQLQDMNLDLAASYILVNDIDASETRGWNDGRGFSPIAKDIGEEVNQFTGSLNGNGCHITDLYINRPSEDNIGLFCDISNSGHISNVSLIGSKVNGDRNVGGLVGFSWFGTIKNCYATGDMSGGWYVGGLVGENGGTVLNCSATGNLTSDSRSGGLVGYNKGTIQNCYATGYVNGKWNIGGLVGFNAGPLENCYATGYVIGEEGIGGLVGWIVSEGPIRNCYATSNVTGDQNIGGLVGLNGGAVWNSYATGNVTGETEYVGGLVGKNKGPIHNSYAIGNVSAHRTVGGLVGMNKDASIENCTSIVNINGSWNIGGLIGNNQFGTVQNCTTASNVSGDNYIGGLIGSSSGTIQNCSSIGNVKGEENVAGLVGFNSGTVQKCSATGNVSGNLSVGGLIGNNQFGSLYDCYTIGNISGIRNVGGLVGQLNLSYNFPWKSFNSFYCINYTTVNNKHYVTPYGIYKNQFEDWISNGKSLDIDDYLSKIPGTNNYNISSVSDMKKMLPFASFPYYKFKQTSDINLASETEFYIPILKSEYNGNGHSISHLEITYYNNDNLGMFGTIYVGGSVVNVSIINSQVSGNDLIGGLSGYNQGVILNCSTAGNTIGIDSVGGLVGFNSATIQNCYATGDMSGGWYVGGLVGFNRDKVNNSYATGEVIGDYEVGGLVGLSDSEGSIRNCYATGNVTGVLNLGGLVGFVTHGSIKNCYATGNVIGDFVIGGLVGFVTYGSITNCYTTGYVTGDVDVGGLVGDNLMSIVENCFWDIDTSSQPNSFGGKGKTTIEMMTKSTFTEAGWDFESIWAINEYVDYPHLQWERRIKIEPDDYDNDSIPDIIDDFPTDPAASIDMDSDGSPDQWNPGMNETNSTTGLHLDAFPLDPAASLDSDKDGMPDKWNPGMDQSDSTSYPPLELDIYPNDPENKSPGDNSTETTTDSSSKTWIWVSVAVMIVLLVAVIFAVVIRKKRKPQEKEEKNDLGRVEPDEK